MKRFITPINVVLFLVFFTLVGTGLTLELRFDEKMRMTVAGFEREDWGEFHFFTALTFIGVVILHLWSNWAWLRKLYQEHRSLAVLILSAFIVVGALVALLPAKQLS